MKYRYAGLIIGSIIFIVLLYYRVSIIFCNTNDVAGTEQNVIYSIQVLLEKGALYLSPAKAPFSVTQYTPVYYYMCAFTAKIFNIGADDIRSLYIIGRSWNLLFNFVTALFLYLIGRKIFNLSKDLSAFLFLASFALIFPHNFAVRSDSMQDMLGIMAICCFLFYEKKAEKGTRPIGLLATGILLSAFAVFTKQSGIQYILLFGAFCLLIKDWRTLFYSIGLSVIIYGALLALFVWQNEYFLQNVIGGVANGINIHDYITYIIGRPVFVISVWPLIILSVYLLVRYNTLFKGEITERLLSAFFFGTLVFSLVTALKMGSSIQYFVPFINLSILFITKVLSEYKSTKIKTSVTAVKTFQVFVILLTIIYLFFYRKVIWYNDLQMANQRVSAMKTAAFVNHGMANYKDKYIFADLTIDPTISSRQSINNILFRQCLVPQMDIMEFSTGPLKVFGYQNLDTMLKTGQVEYIIEANPRFRYVILNDMADVINTKYALVKKIDGYLIYQLNGPVLK